MVYLLCLALYCFLFALWLFHGSQQLVLHVGLVVLLATSHVMSMHGLHEDLFVDFCLGLGAALSLYACVHLSHVVYSLAC